MNAVRKIKTPVSHLRVIKGGKSNPKNNIVENTWNFIHAAIWNNSEFSYKEKTQFQNLIGDHYNTFKNPEKVFEEIIERVCLAKRFITRKRGRYIAKPINWLNINYYAGLTGTEGWYQEVCLQRITVPDYNYGITLLAEQSSKDELINKAMQLQERDKELMDKLTAMYNSKREAGESHKETIEEYKKRIEELIKKLAHYEVVAEEYKRVADLKLGNTYNINATWIDKIVFVLKASGRPLRSSEIIDVLLKNDMMFRTLTDHQKGLSAHLTKALKYGRIIGTKQKGQNGYIYSLPAV